MQISVIYKMIYGTKHVYIFLEGAVGMWVLYESLSLVVLKDLAKARGLKGISTMKKGELIDRMLQEDEREKEAAPKAKTVYTARTASGQEGRKHTPKPRREEHSSHTEDHSHPEHGESMHAEHGAHASQE